MFPGDVVVGWIKDGSIHFSVSHIKNLLDTLSTTKMFKMFPKAEQNESFKNYSSNILNARTLD
jgi:hypothetical protein